MERVLVESLAAAAPVRDFRWYKGRTFYSGWYWSSTTAGLVAYESRLELARILLADFDPSVCGLVAQPFQMVESRDGIVRRHVPDLLLVHVDQSVTVVDVKPAHRLADPSVRQVFDWTAAVVALRGWRFEAWSAEDPVVLANVRYLAGYRRPFVVDTSLKDCVLDLVDRQGTVSGVEYVASAIAVVGLVRPVLLHLLWTGALQTDLSRPLGSDSPIWRAGSR